MHAAACRVLGLRVQDVEHAFTANGFQQAEMLLPCRYLPEDVFRSSSQERPLIGQRMDIAAAELGEELDSLPLLERTLRCQSPDAHAEIAATLWDSSSDEEARGALEQLADQKLSEWENNDSDREEQVAEG